MRVVQEMYPSPEEVEHTVRCLFAVYLLSWAFYAFVLRRAVKEAQDRSKDGTDWVDLCASVIFARLLFPSTFLIAMIIYALEPMAWGTCGSMAGEAGLAVLLSSSIAGGTAAFVGAFLAFCLAGSTPQKVLPRIYAVLLLPFAWITYGLLEILWL